MIPADLPLGGIIGAVDLVDCVEPVKMSMMKAGITPDSGRSSCEIRKFCLLLR